MITSIMMGGLGNQMFQYAAVKAISTKLNTDFSIDISSYVINKGKSWCRPFELTDVFAIPTDNIVQSTNIAKQIQLFCLARYRHSVGCQWYKKYCNIYDEEDYITPQWDLITSKSTLYGYFQDVQYFENNILNLSQDFQFAQKLDGVNLEISRKIKQENSVSVHIRRGDYLIGGNKNLFVNLTQEWYRHAIDLIRQKTDDVSLFFFSDDIAWCRENFSDLNGSTFVDWNTGDKSYIDMQLMSFCKHNIIANSTFSIWGALLNSNANKMVISPSSYYKNKDDGNLNKKIPSDWFTL